VLDASSYALFALCATATTTTATKNKITENNNKTKPKPKLFSLRRCKDMKGKEQN
jgi:hypothetical protein